MNKLLAKYIYLLAQKARGEETTKKIEEMKKTQWLPYSQIKQQQQEKVEEILQYAARNVPFYRERLKGIKGFQDFEKIRVLTREDVRNNLDSLISEEYPLKRLLEYHSSGSTGEPLTLYFTPEAMGYFHAAQYRGFSWYGLGSVDKCIKLWGFPLKFIPKLKEALRDFVMNRKRISAFDMSEESMERYYRKCLRFKPEFLYGYASALTKFGQYLREKNIDGRSLRLKAVISTSEILYEHQRKLLEDVFGCKIVNEYGAAEAGIIAFECPQGGVHLTSENVYVEILRNGKPTEKEGEIGEVVLTELHNYALPLIRYKLGDLAVSSSRQCPCGRALPLLESIQGRSNDLVVTPEGKSLHSEVFSYINRDLMSQGFLIKEFKIIQELKDKLNVLVTHSASEAAVNALKKQIKKHVGQGMEIGISAVDSIPLEKSGKMRYFISKVKTT
jgi:phenylacetate-CoA ligase